MYTSIFTANRVTTRFTLPVVALFVLFSCFRLSAGTTGKLVGFIKEVETGRPLQGANVVIQGKFMGASSDADGFYHITNIPPGVYTITVSIIGYTDMSVEQVRIITDKTTTMDFNLRGEILEGEMVSVIAQRPIIQKDNTSTVKFVNSRDLEIMPVSGFNQLVTQSAGVTTDYRGTHIRGGRVSETAYQLDGLSIQENVFGYQGGNVPTVSVAEVTILSGGFNAEYGNAQSGVINVVTKEGGERFEGEYEILSEFPDEDPKLETGYQKHVVSLSGPIPMLEGRLRYFISSEFISADDGNPGIRKVVQPIKTLNAFSKLSYTNVAHNIKVTLGILSNRNQYTSYMSAYQLLPENFPKTKTNVQRYSLTFTHALRENLFYSLDLGYYNNDYISHQTGKWWDIRQNEDWNTIDGSDLTDTAGSSFAINNYSIDSVYLETNSDYNGFFARRTTKLTQKGNITWIAGRHNTFKAGFEINLHDINYLTIWGIGGYPYTFLFGNEQPVIEGNQIVRMKLPDSLGFKPVRPKNSSFYFQDKMEYDGMIMNIGLRLDIFDPAASFPKDLWYAFYPGGDTTIYGSSPDYGGPDQDIPTLRDNNLKKASIKTNLSPRLGVSYPITDRDAMHFSYGHFVQIPAYHNLYQNQNFSYDYWWIVGNPDLNWEKTIAYEVGVAHGFSDNLAVDFTAFYKDINNLINIQNFADPNGSDVPPDSTGPVDTFMGIQTYVNEDWGNVKGFEFSLRKRHSPPSRISGTLSYTYMNAKGKSSDTREGLLRRSNGTRPTIKYFPLDWDMRHKLVANLDYRLLDNFGINITAYYNTGLPFTGPQQSIEWEYNDRVLPDVAWIDMKINKTFIMGKIRINGYILVYNLTNRKNVTRFNDEATYVPIVTYLQEHPGEWGGPLDNPLVYGLHREIRAGLVFNF